MSLQSLRDGLEDLLSDGQVKARTQEEQYQIAKAFWRVVAEVWGDVWVSPKRHLLTKSLGMIAVSKLGGDLIPMCLNGRGQEPEDLIDIDKLRGLLLRAAGFDWSSTGDLHGIAGRGGAKVVKDRLDAMIFARPE